MDKYDHKKIEARWQKKWEKEKAFAAKDNDPRPKFYALIEFPYPSGDGLHVGHVRPHTAMDIIARKRRMEGYNVLYPIGFDSFGLPTENYAIKTGRPPAEVTKENIENFTKQIKMTGMSFDWDRAVTTSDPAYYKWTQWIFLQLFKHGLAYKKKMAINWCPSCKIGLANEEVVDGSCERCGTPVEKREKEQWMLAITKYADKLLEGLKEVDYIDRAKVQQENWIGRSEGAEIEFRIKNEELRIKVFTTRPDTLFGATYLVLAPEHALLMNDELGIKNYEEVKKYIDNVRGKTEQERLNADKEKTGVELKGVKAINPATKEEISIWVADYVLSGYGTSAIMAVPAHDERDFEFAKKFGLPIKQVIAPETGIRRENEERRDGGCGIVFDPKTQKYGVWKRPDGFCGFFGGGVEDSEDEQEGVLREVKEESGLYDFTHVEKVAVAFAHYRNEPKKLNRVAKAACYLVVLNSNKTKPTQHEAHEKLELAWTSPEEIFKKWQEMASVKDIKDTEHWVRFLYEAVAKAIELGYDKTSNPKIYKATALLVAGVLINSGKFNGLDNETAKSKITEAVGGVKKVQYKLRDWVFSRQRYWGEPIPLVYCETCAKKKHHFVLMSDFKGSSQTSFRPWLEKELKTKGFEVHNIDLPNWDEPNANKLVAYLESLNIFDRDTTVITHSLTGPLMLKLLATGKIFLHQLILVAPPQKAGALRDGKARPPLDAFCDWKFDYEKVKSQVGHIAVLSDIEDSVVFPEQPRDIARKLGGYLQEVVAPKPHFNCDEVPEILDMALTCTKKNNGWIPLPEKELPLELPKVEKYQPTDTGESPLAAMGEWVNTKCPRCGGPARRETDTMPNWAGSSWYFLRYCDPENKKEFASMEKLKYWMGVDWYNGGMEHTVLHLLYSRFWNQFLYDIGLVPTREPYKKRTSHGMILAEDGEKMSKSRGNVINPNEIVEKYGADVLRVYEMFMGPFDQAVPWSTKSIAGVARFLERIWNLQEKVVPEIAASSASGRTPRNDGLERLVHKTIKKVSEDIEAMKYNTAIAAMMSLVNEMSKQDYLLPTNYYILLQLLSPFAPHICEEIWERVHCPSPGLRPPSPAGRGEGEGLLCQQPWPKWDSKLVKDEEIELVVQVNGKVRERMRVAADISEDEAKALALGSEKVKKWLDGQKVKEVIFVKGKLVNIVLADH